MTDISMNAKRRGLGFAFAAMAVAAFVGPAAAQENQPAAPTANDASAWVKVCEKDPNDETNEICIVTQELRDENGRFLASAGIRIGAKDGKKALIFGLPLGMLLQPGIRYQIDQGEQTSGEYGICLPTGCFAELAIEDAAVNALKKGNELILMAISGRGQTVPFRMSLIGFTKTFDGPPIDPKVLAETQKKLQEEIQRRAEAARKKLMEQQQGNAEQPAGAESAN